MHKSPTLFCVFCGVVVRGGEITRMMDGKISCLACASARAMWNEKGPKQMKRKDTLAEQCAKVEIDRIESERLFGARVIGRSIEERGDFRRIVSDAIGQAQLESWEEGFAAAIRIVEHEGAHAVAEVLRKARDDYWRTQGIEPEETP